VLTVVFWFLVALNMYCGFMLRNVCLISFYFNTFLAIWVALFYCVP
jgi:hypothetical protein